MLLAVTIDLNYNNYHIILYWSLHSLTLCFLFCFVIAYLHCRISASHPKVRLSRGPGVRVSLTFCLHWPCGMLCQFSLCHQAVGCLNSPAVCIARVLLLPSVGTWSLVHHGFCTLWTVFKTYCVTCFCWHWLPRSLGVVHLHYWENTFPLFPKGFFFRVFVSGGYTSNQCQPIRHTQGLRLLIMCPSWKADWVSGLFFHDLGRIQASLSHLPRCSKVTYLGLVVF